MTKRRLDDLAVFGGPPSFVQPQHVGRPNLGDRAKLLERLNDALDRGWLTNHGPYEQEFERRLAAMLGVKHCLATCNATVGLEIAIRAAGLTGEVIVPAFTAAATPHSVYWLGLTPVFCDIDPLTHNIDPQRVKDLITPRTSAILAVNLWGRPCDIEALSDLARRHQIKLLFDSSHALLCSHRGELVGGFGDAEIFSFHATKVCNSLEGGAITTNDDGLADKIDRMRTFGFRGADNVECEGTNGKLDEFSAAMGLTSLESLPDFVAANHRNWGRAVHNLKGVPGVEVIEYNERESNNYHYLVLEIDASRAGVSRDALVHILTKENVLARRHFYPGCHRWEPYHTLYPQNRARLPRTDEVASRVMQLPNGTSVSEHAIDEMCSVIRVVVENSAETARRLSAAGFPFGPASSR
jgi:dTDP-4-amino-4,6-dideoxygalactose transaminase